MYIAGSELAEFVIPVERFTLVDADRFANKTDFGPITK